MKQKKGINRILSLVLCAAMCLGLMPAGAMAFGPAAGLSPAPSLTDGKFVSDPIYGLTPDTLELSELGAQELVDQFLSVVVEGAELLGVTDITEDALVAEAMEAFDHLEQYVAYDIVADISRSRSTASVTVPIPEDWEVGTLRAYYISDEGLVEEVIEGIYDADARTFTFPVSHFSKYVVGNETVSEEVDVDPETSGGSKHAYVLVSTPTAGKQYIIANRNTAGNGNALNNSTSGTTVTVNAAGNGFSAPYIETSNKEIMWNTAAGLTFQNERSEKYIARSTRSLSFSDSPHNWVAGTNSIYSTRVLVDYYLRYDNGWELNGGWGTAYFYEKTDINGTYSVAGDPDEVSKIVMQNDTATLGSTLTFTPDSGTATTTDVSATATYAVYSDPAGVIASISGNTVTFSGKYGTALVKVSDSTHEVSNYITVTAEEPTFGVDITVNGNVVDAHEAEYVQPGSELQLGAAFVTDHGTYTPASPSLTWEILSGEDVVESVDSTGKIVFTGQEGSATIKLTYSWTEQGVDYSRTDSILITATGAVYSVDIVDPANQNASITETIVIKDVTDTTTDQLAAVVSCATSATDFSDVSDAVVVWESNNPGVADVDENGIVTFTGLDGTVQITASYEYADGTKQVADTVTYSVTASSNYLPSDGTSDFPEYPNEGAIRFDKTAASVGNFSQTGTALVELSMTGVPYNKNNEIDVVIMVDMSDSMKNNNAGRVEPARTSAVNALKAIVTNENETISNSRVGVYTFNGYDGEEGAQNYANAVDTVLELQSYQTADPSSTTKLDQAVNIINRDIVNNKTGAGTNYGAALEKCYSVLNAARAEYPERKQYVIFVTDGEPTTGFAYETTDGSVADDGYDNNYQYGAANKYYTYTEYYSKQMRAAGVEIYTVGIQLDNDNANTILKKIAGNKDGTAHANSASHGTYAQFIGKTESASKLVEIFASIVNEIKQAATNVVVEDKVGKNYSMNFSMPAGVSDEDTGELSEFYVQAVQYQLDDDKERTGTPTVLENFTFNSSGTLKSHTVDGTACSGCSHVTFSGTTVTAIDGKYFDYVNDAQGEVITWTADKLDTTELALQYFVHLDNSTGADAVGKIPAGSYYTNEYATLTYTNHLDHRCEQKFPVPQQTWKGAQVTYVFYLVNEAGQPVNRAGKVIPFAEAIEVTDPVVKAVTWNSELGTNNMLAENLLASANVPSVYSLYDKNAYYEVLVYQTEGVDSDENAVNFNHFIIEGSDTIVNKSTTKVYNTKAGARYDQYGAYSAVVRNYTSDESKGGSGNSYLATKTTDIDYADTTVAFAVVWNQSLKEDTVVIDYGLDVVIDVAQNDAVDTTVVGVRTDPPAGVTMNTGTFTNPGKKPSVTGGDGLWTASRENQDAVRFHMNKMGISAPATFYYEAEVSYYDDAVLNTTYMYSSVTVIPATSIYYEESFVLDFNNSPAASGDMGVWGLEGTADSNATQEVDRPGVDKMGNGYDADNIYGYDSAYDAYTMYSLGSAMKVTVDAATGAFGAAPNAKFSFTGTGFDIVSLTDNDSGTIIVIVTDAATGAVVKYTNVDNYYGYDNYAYYSIPYTKNSNGAWVKGTPAEMTEEAYTAAISGLTAEENGTYVVTAVDGTTKTVYGTGLWVPTSNDKCLWQVPVMKIDGLTYGTYNVEIQLAYMTQLDHLKDGSYSFWLDAIRVYNPAAADDSVSNDAYEADGEASPSYITLKKLLLSKAQLVGGTINGAVFIDGIESTDNVADYTDPGPNNETYLAVGQGVSFKLIASQKPSAVHIGAKLATGTEANLMVGMGSTTQVLTKLTTATDMYYELPVVWKADKNSSGYYESEVILLSNGSYESDLNTNTIVSITNLKAIGADWNTELVVNDTETAGVFALDSARKATLSNAGLSKLPTKAVELAKEKISAQALNKLEAVMTKQVSRVLSLEKLDGGMRMELTGVSKADIQAEEAAQTAMIAAIALDEEPIANTNAVIGAVVDSETVETANYLMVKLFTEPETPDEPETPEEPEKPSKPEKPDQSDDDEKPSKPSKPSKPDKDKDKPFKPDRFDFKWNQGKGNKKVLTFTTGSDVDYIVINGKVITDYEEQTRGYGIGKLLSKLIFGILGQNDTHTTRVWNYDVDKTNQSASGYEVVAYNAQGLASDAMKISASGKR